MRGTFVDDYNVTNRIAEDTWHQLPGERYHIVSWQLEAGFLIAQNDTSNTADGGLWTRIDWVRLNDMEPYTWAYCLSAYDAPSAAAAESTRVAQPDTPRTGCNGFPYSRMRRP